jgi:hypothetical protein
VIERTNSWRNRRFKVLAIVTDRRAVVQNTWVALASTVIVIRRPTSGLDGLPVGCPHGPTALTYPRDL